MIADRIRRTAHPPRRSRWRLALWIGLCACFTSWACTACTAGERAGEEQAESVPAPIVHRNLDESPVFGAAYTDSVLAAESGLSTAARIGAWARRFLAADAAIYTFGPADGGYVAEGRLVLDDRQDCVSLMYRCSELARANSAVDALAVALRTRFAGGSFDSIAGPDGRVDYDRPEHLDYSLDMVRSGYWGRNVTDSLSGATPDPAGSSRYPARSFRTVPAAALDPDELLEGDIAWLVLDPDHESGGRLRREYGLVIGHLGVVVREPDGPWLIHAASRPLPGFYEEGGVVAVPLQAYLERVGKFSGLMVTRFP